MSVLADGWPDSKSFAGLTVTVYVAAQATVVELRGEFDAYTARELRRHLSAYPPGRFADVVLDLRELGFIDSAGIAVIVALGKRAAAQHGSLRLVAPENSLLVKLRRMGLVKLWPIHCDVESAVAGLCHDEQTAEASPCQPSPTVLAPRFRQAPAGDLDHEDPLRSWHPSGAESGGDIPRAIR
jgi:anti-sigma B factor antagonist